MMTRFGSVIIAALVADAAASWTVTNYYYVCSSPAGFTATLLKVMVTIPDCHLPISNQEKAQISNASECSCRRPLSMLLIRLSRRS